MIGNPKELLFYLTSHKEWWQGHGITGKQASDMRNRLLNDNISKECLYDSLEALGCTLLRDEIYLPSVWTDGKVELANKQMLDLIMTKKKWYEPLGFDRFKAFDYKRRLWNLPEDTVDGLLVKLGCTKLYDGLLMPSAWEYVSWLTENPITTKARLLHRLIYEEGEI